MAASKEKKGRKKKKEISTKKTRGKKKMPMNQICTHASGSFSLAVYRLRKCFKFVFVDQIYGLTAFFFKNIYQSIHRLVVHLVAFMLIFLINAFHYGA